MTGMRQREIGLQTLSCCLGDPGSTPMCKVYLVEINVKLKGQDLATFFLHIVIDPNSNI